MTDSLRELLLSIVPDDGSAVGNLALAAAMREIVPDLSDETYQRIRDGLIAEGALGKGRGRGGSVFLLGLDDEEDEINYRDGDGFSLTAQEASAPAAPVQPRPGRRCRPTVAAARASAPSAAT